MQTCKTIYENSAENFEMIVNELLEKGYKINSSNCTTVIQKQYDDFITIYQAILIKEEE